MATNESLLGVSENLYTPEIIQKISDTLGQSVGKTKEGLKSVVPEFMKGIVDKGSTQEGASTLVDIINTHKFESKIPLDENKLSESNEVVNNIFGSNFNNIVSRLGTSTGLGASNITKMFGLVAPFFMGAINSKVKSEKLSAAGLMNFFNQQKTVLISAISTGTSGPSDYYALTGEEAEGRAYKKSFFQNVSWMKIILVGLVLGGMGVWWNLVQIKSTEVLPPVSELRTVLSEGTITDRPIHFRFEKIAFTAGTTRMIQGSDLELGYVVNVMKEYPMAKIRIEGFTDNTGSAEANKILSNDRAVVLKEELVARGIAANRIETVGMGEASPLVSNTTAKGRAKNNRIELVILNY